MPVIRVPRWPLHNLFLGSFIALVYNVKLPHNSVTVENVLHQCILVAFCHAVVNVMWQLWHWCNISIDITISIIISEVYTWEFSYTISAASDNTKITIQTYQVLLKFGWFLIPYLEDCMQSPGLQLHHEGGDSPKHTVLTSGVVRGPSWSEFLILGDGAGEEHSHSLVPGRGPRHACTSSAHHTSISQL